MSRADGRRPTVRWLLLLFAVLGVAGCQVDVAIDVAVSGDESGEVVVTVILDQAASAEVPGLADELEVEDLRRSGWDVAVTDEPDGGLAVRAVREFTSLEEATAISEELSGPDGPFALTFDRRSAADATIFSVAGEVDLTSGLAAFSDAGLRDVLGEDGLGFSEAELEQRAGRPLSEAVGFRVDARLPGHAMGPAGPAGPVEAPLGAETPVVFRSEVRHDERIAWGLAAVSAVVLLALVLITRAVRGLRRRVRARRGQAHTGNVLR